MLRKGESQLKVGRESFQQQHSRTSWVRPSVVDFIKIAQIEWMCPPQFIVDPRWKMEAGSVSRETHVQIQRELRSAEAIYHHKSGIPSDPCIASDEVGFNDGDSSVPNIPLDVINDDTSPDEDDNGVPLTTLSPSAKEVGETTRQPLSVVSQDSLVKGRPEVCLLQTDEVLETAMALIGLIKSKEPGNQIDFELLIQILRNPGMLDQMMKEHQLSVNQESSSVPNPPRSIHNTVVAKPLSVPEPKVTVGASTTTCYSSVPFVHSMSQGVKNMRSRNSERQIPGSSTFDVGKIRKLANEYGAPSRPGPVLVNKDLDYYRRLVSQHGTMNQENHSTQVCVKTVEQQMPCAYFNSPRGCRRGSSCRFQHVKVTSFEEHHAPKRMKLSGGNFVRHK